MTPDLQREFQLLSDCARKQLREVPESGSYCHVFSIWTMPSFSPPFRCTIYSPLPNAIGKQPFADFYVWRSDLDLEKLRSPVERLKHPKDLIPTLESEVVWLTADEVKQMEQTIRGVSVPLYLGQGSIAGCDGTSFEFRYAVTNRTTASVNGRHSAPKANGKLGPFRWHFRTMSKRIRNIVLGILTLLAIATTVVFVVPIFMPWTELNYSDQELDINSGRLRFSRCVLFCRVSQRIEDSALTKELPASLLHHEAEWYMVNRFSPGVRHSPHYAFHGGIHQIRTLGNVWEMLNLAPAIRQRTAAHVLALWKHAGGDSLAGDYINGLMDLDDSTNRENSIRKLAALEMPKLETNGTVIIQTVFFPNGQPMDRQESSVSNGRLIKHGVWEMWYSGGKRQLHGYFRNGKLDGRRFEWNRSGELTTIEGFKAGKLTEYESTNLSNHPDYAVAQKLNASPE